MTTLHSRAREDVTLADALAQVGFNDGVALLSSPQRHVAARVFGGECQAAELDFPLDSSFEARVFDGERELRWLCTSGTLGRAVLLTEDAALLPTEFGVHVPPLVAEGGTVETHYLLWGASQPTAQEGWTMLHTPRIGTLTIPAPPTETKSRLRLTTCEYLAVEPEHGNAYVGEERLLRIEPTGSHADRR